MKAMKLLARRLRKQQADSTIQKIQDPISKQVFHNSEDFQRVFEGYYRKLYTQTQAVDPVEINAFLTPLISDTLNAKLTADITEEEINKALFRLKINKSPGPDGFPKDIRFLDNKLPQFYYQLLIVFYKEANCHLRGEKL